MQSTTTIIQNDNDGLPYSETFASAQHKKSHRAGRKSLSVIADHLRGGSLQIKMPILEEGHGHRTTSYSSASASIASPVCQQIQSFHFSNRIFKILLRALSIVAVVSLVAHVLSTLLPPVAKVAPRSITRTLPGLNDGVTIVSGFFLIGTGRKHSPNEYWYWINIFLTTVEQPIVFYTSPDLAPTFKEMRGNKPITIISDYETAYDMPPVLKLGGREWGKIMNSIDPEQYKHVDGVYGPWTAKPWMVQHAKNINRYKSKYFFWVDAGGFREESAQHTMKALSPRLDALYRTVPRDTIVLGDVNFPWPEGTKYVKAATETGEMDRTDCHIQGGWFGGTAAAVDWWESETLRVTTLQAGLQRFAGKEQDTWTHTARLNWPRILVMNMFGQNGHCGYDSWFSYLYWSDDPVCEIPFWNGPEYFKAEQASLRKAAQSSGR